MMAATCRLRTRGNIDFTAQHGCLDAFDDSDLEAGDCEQQGADMVESQDFEYTISNQLLLVTLLEHLCCLYESNPQRSRHLFLAIARRLARMGLISPAAFLDEFGSVRLQFSKALRELMRSASNQFEDFFSDGIPWPISLLRKKGKFLQLQTSRYHSEFEEICCIGRGGYGQVFKARNKLDGQLYAMKKVLIKDPSENMCTKVLREVKVLASLQHPNVVRYHSTWLQLHMPTCADPMSKSKKTSSTIPMPTDWNICALCQKRSENEPLRDARNGSLTGFGTLEGQLAAGSMLKLSADSSSGSIVFEDPASSRMDNRTVLIMPTLEQGVQKQFGALQPSQDDKPDCIGPAIKIGCSTGSRSSNSDVSVLPPSVSANSKLPVLPPSVSPNSSLLMCQAGRHTSNLLHRAAESFQSIDISASKNSHTGVREIACYKVDALAGNFSGEWFATGLKQKDIEGRQEESSNKRTENFQEEETKMQLCECSLQEWFAERNGWIPMLPYKSSDIRTGPFEHVNEEYSLHIFKQLLEGVHYIHSCGIVHRDLKPRNVFLLRSDLHVHIGDFGLACQEVMDKPVTLRPGKEFSDLGSTHTFGVGTSLYAAPEQLSGSQYDSKSDMYSVGLLLFELFQPFGTEMERVRTIEDLRCGKLPDEFSVHWPTHSITVQELTSTIPCRRPSADELLRCEVVQSKDEVIFALRKLLAKSTAEVDFLRCRVKEQNELIGRLQQMVI
uniref:eukaryotic translation initiation factor 2-alpha kinase 1 isoform X3 n=1 Tax=Myxine glutinosa TaxID=7769 RepID=UPI00358E1C04